MAGWTPERLELAQKLKASGLTCLQVAAAMGGFEGCAEQGRLSVSGALWRAKRTAAQLAKLRAERNGRRPKRSYQVSIDRALDEDQTLAAAIVADGGSYADAMAETGLTHKEVARAVERSRVRENYEVQRARAKGVEIATAWGTLGSVRDAR